MIGMYSPVELLIIVLLGFSIAGALWTSPTLGLGGKFGAIMVILMFVHVLSPRLAAILVDGFFTGLAQQGWLIPAATVGVLLWALLMMVGLWRPKNGRGK